MTGFLVLVHLLVMVVAFESAQAQERPQPSRAAAPTASCDSLLPAQRQAGERKIGPDECRIVSEEIVFNLKGQRYQRLELRMSGTVEGWAARQGPSFNYFTDAPEFVLAQYGNTTEQFRGIGRYSASTGHGMSVFLPEDRAHWNGKLFVTTHGAGAYAAIGALLPRHPNEEFHALTNVNRYVGLMLDRGYAVAHAMRSSQLAGGDVTVTLDDGTTLPKYNVSSHAGFIIDFATTATNIVQKKLGRMPERTYFYGFSAGGFLGRLLQYRPGFNVGPNGRPRFDGFLIDDAGGGRWLPILMVDGKDTLFQRDEDRKRFVPQIDVTHQLYAGETGDYLKMKRENATLLKQKGLASKHRMYEVKGVSHFDAGQVSRPDHVPQTLDLGGLVESLIDALDLWVEKGTAPSGNAAIALPEIACPLGVYYPYPAVLGDTRRGGQETGFAPFDGVNLEPLDGRGQIVDMNGNGRRDTRETVAQAWTRLGLLAPGERFTRARYVTCVTNAATKLVTEGLLPPRLLSHYVKQAVASGVGEAE
jgi:Alpha/beta hydrolase domain